MKPRMFHLLLPVMGFALCVSHVPHANAAADTVSKVIALRGQASIEREQTRMDAHVNDGLTLADKVSTADASRAKMLFLDDSVLTLGERSRVGIREYLLKKDDRGRSIFNLLDGKMRAVVGRTEFEVHTPTAVAAARGTVILFETGARDGRRYSTIQVTEGTVEVRSASPAIKGTVLLTAGMEVTVFEGEELPAPSKAGKEALDRLWLATDISTAEIRFLPPGRTAGSGERRGGSAPTAPARDSDRAPWLPLVNQQPLPALGPAGGGAGGGNNSTSVNVGLNF